MPYNEPISKLSELDPAKPAGSEPRSVVDDVIRQLKGFLVSFLSVSHTDGGELKPGSVGSGVILPGTIRGSGTGETVREIAQGTIGSKDIALGAVTGLHIAAGAVDSTRLAAKSVTESKLGDGAVVSRVIADGAVVAGKLGSGAVTGANIASGAITADHLSEAAVSGVKVGDSSIPPEKLKSSTNNAFLLGNGSNFREVTIDSESSVVMEVVSNKVKFHLTNAVGSGGGAARGYVILQERQNKGISGGNSAANTWNQRNAGGSWVMVRNIGGLVEADGETIKIVTKGTYLIRAWACVYGGVGIHRVALCKQGESSWPLIVAGAGGYNAAGSTSIATLESVQDLDAGVKLTLFHYTQNAVTDGLGKALNLAYGSSNLPEVYAEVIFILI